VLVEWILPTFLKRDDALDLLEERVTNNLLKVSSLSVLSLDWQEILSPEGWYTAKRSTFDCTMQYLLCTFGTKKSPFLTDGDGLLLRLIHDFLFISMNRDHASQFYSI
jgi:hypothetical protein